jgi:diketogulonate reductase-like aldo/keto reductase
MIIETAGMVGAEENVAEAEKEGRAEENAVEALKGTQKIPEEETESLVEVIEAEIESLETKKVTIMKKE